MGKVFIGRGSKGRQPRLTIDKSLRGRTIAYTSIDDSLSKLARKLGKNEKRS